MMREILWLPLLAVVCAFTSVHADVTAVLHVDGMGGGWNFDTHVMVKGEHARDDFLGIQIVNLKTGEKIALMPVEKSYLKIPGHAMKPPPPMDLKPTGKKDTISGYATDGYTGIIDRMKMTLWLAKAKPEDADVLKGMAAFYDLDAASLAGLPIRIVEEPQPGVFVTVTLVSISAKPIADSEFEIPAGYKQMDEPPAHPQ